MINSRSIVISILGAVLTAAPMVYAQDAQPTGPAVIQELAFQSQPLLEGPLFRAESLLSSAQAPDLSQYREFRLGMALPEVAKLTGTEVSEATVIHQRPVLLQELDWRLPLGVDSSSSADPVESVNFAFYGGELFRMAVNYDSDRTAGLSQADLIKAISATYGAPARLAVKTTFVPLSLTDASAEKVVARWETVQYSVSLFRSSDESGFGIILLSKRLDALARTAAAEGTRIEDRDAPQREIARLKQEQEDNLAAKAKAKLANQAAFRP